MSSSSYDGVIEYWSEEAWKKYFGEDLGTLYRSCNEVMAMGEFFKEKVDGQQLSEILSDKLLFKCLLGGLKEDGTYDENGLATFCDRFFGVEIKEQAELIGRLKVGLSIQDAAKNLEGTCIRTVFLDMLDRLSKSLERIFHQLKDFVMLEVPEVKIEEAIKDPKEVCERVRDFLQRCLSISPNYNPYTFFITSLFRISRKYMEQAYPLLKDEKTFNFIRQLLGLSEVITLEIPDEKIVHDYTVWGFDEGSVGYELVSNLVNTAWDFTELDVIQKYFNVKSERELYLERAIGAWKNVAPRGKDWSDMINGIKRYTLSNYKERIGILKLPNPARSIAGINSYSSVEPLKGINLEHVHFLRFIDYISPQLFLNIAFIEGEKRLGRVSWEVMVYE